MEEMMLSTKTEELLKDLIEKHVMREIHAILKHMEQEKIIHCSVGVDFLCKSMVPVINLAIKSGINDTQGKLLEAYEAAVNGGHND